MRSIARWSFTHRRAALALWLVALIGLTVIHSAAGSDYKDICILSGT